MTAPVRITIIGGRFLPVRCYCGRPVTTRSSCGCCCVEHDHPEKEN